MALALVEVLDPDVILISVAKRYLKRISFPRVALSRSYGRWIANGHTESWAACLTFAKATDQASVRRRGATAVRNNFQFGEERIGRGN